MNKSFLLVGIAIFILCLTPSAFSQLQFTDAHPVYTETIFAQPLGISADCVEDGSQCLAVVLANTLGGYELRMYSSTDGFETQTQMHGIAIGDDRYAKIYEKMRNESDSNFMLPFGVKYNSDDGLYYIFTNEKIYTYDLTSPPVEIVDADSDIFNSHVPFGTPSATNFIGLVNNKDPYIVTINDYGLDTTYCDTNIGVYNLFNQSEVAYYDVKRVVGGGHCIDTYDNAYGIFLATSPSAINISENVAWYVNSDNQRPEHINVDTFPTFDTLYYYDYISNTLKYESNYSETHGIIEAETSDFATFDTSFEYATNPPVFNISGYSYKINDNSAIFTYLNDTTTDIAYFYQQPFYQTFCLGEYYDAISDYYRPFDIACEVNCINISYSESGYDDVVSLSHPCDTYNLTITATVNDRPIQYSDQFALHDGCNYNFLKFRFIRKYNYTIKIVDDITGNPIENALVQFGSQSKYTNSYGEATFSIMPPNDITMSQSSVSDCSETWVSSSSSLNTYLLTVTKSGYNSIINEDVTDEVARIEDGNIVYETFLQKNIVPVGATVNVRLRDKNGIEIDNEELSSITEISSDDVSSFLIVTESDTYLGNRASGVPVTFYMISNESEWNLTINFSYIDFYDSTNLTIEQDDVATVWFNLNTSITDMKCEYNYDCQTDFCKGSFWYQLTGCINGACTYEDPELCAGGCDDEIGCYERKLDIICETDNQCPSNCTSDWVSYIGLCASDGYCVQIKDVCEMPCVDENVGCNATTGICCESEECREVGTRKYLFQLSYYWISGFPPVTNSKLLLDYRYYCGIENRGERKCLSGASIPIEVSGSKTTTASNPDSWKFRTEDNFYRFFDVSVYCGTNCEAEWSYCPYGCNFETGYCYHQPTEEVNITEKYEIDIYKPISIIEDSLNETQIRESGLGFLLLLATPVFIVTVISILIGALVGFVTKEPLLAVVGFIAILVVFSILQLFPIWIAIALILVAGLIFSKMFLNTIRGR